MILEWDMWEISEEIRKALWHSYNSSVRLIELVNDVLSIWKIESWKMKYNYDYYKITDIINSVYNDINIAMKDKWLNFYIDFDQNLRDSKIKTDKDKLKQVFINLLTNSLKFTEKWWNITLKSSKIWNKVLFEIIDNWIWIQKEKIKTLFSKFSQVESSLQRQNTSWLWLWLAICDNFIKEFNSEIKIDSQLWKWSNFYFELDIV
jgi:K+-sensing histidine kinase KdpD